MRDGELGRDQYRGARRRETAYLPRPARQRKPHREQNRAGLRDALERP